MTHDAGLIKEIAREAAQEAVNGTLLQLGIGTTDPIEAQADMAALRELREFVESEETQADLLHLRRWRKNMESVQSKGMMAALAMLCTGALAFILYAFNIKTGSWPK